MDRLTTDKHVSEMNMMELAYNSLYADENGLARYRDFDTDIDARELARDLMQNYYLWDESDNAVHDDDVFDDEILENLMYGTKEIQGLIALFYRNLWAMADLRERLKQYEDAEENGNIIKFPFKLGGTLYDIYEFIDNYEHPEIYAINASKVEISIDEKGVLYSVDGVDCREKDFGTTLFGSMKEAEAALEKMKSEVQP